MPFSSPLDSPSEKANTVERLMPMTFGLRSSTHGLERQPLVVAPQFGLLAAADVAGGRRGRAAGVEDPALRGAAQRDAFDAASPRPALPAGGAAVEEDVDRAAPGREGLGRDDGGEDRVLVVLAHRHHPHVDAVVAHQPGQEGVEPLAQPRLLHRRLLAQGAEGPLGRHLGGGRHRRGHEHEDPADATTSERDEGPRARPAVPCG